jgi:regulatory protein
MIQAAMADCDVVWTEQADQVRAKRFGDPRPRDARETARQQRFLYYRGFSGEQIAAVLGKF